MNPEKIQKLLESVANGKTSASQAYEKLKLLPYENLDFAQVDHHRELRTGLPEVIYCQGKQPEQILKIIRQQQKLGSDILATRLDAEVYKKIKSKLSSKFHYHDSARILTLLKKKKKPVGRIAVVSAGTADIPVAEEAAVTAETFGNGVERYFDIGVAGLHRLLDKTEKLRAARVVIVTAGMDGALASVVGGLVNRPVIGVPTSVGYGASFEGVAPLLTMLNSCAAGVGVVNIDNGFGAACLAHKINRVE